MHRAVTVREVGGPEALIWDHVQDVEPGPGEALVSTTRAGVNYIDVYHRTGLYPLPLPFVPGVETVGTVQALGDGVAAPTPGTRVAYVGAPGGYAEQRAVPAERLIPLPDGVTDDQAAAVMLQGMTAQILLRRVYDVRPGDHVLIHAAAGGVGLLMCQWAAALGAVVIGTVSSDEKAALASENGCAHPIVYTREDFVDRVTSITAGSMLPVVYDSIGKTTFDDSLRCLRPAGLMVTFGQSSGPVPPVETSTLAQRGSLFLTRPSIFTYIAQAEALQATAREVLQAVESGVLQPVIGRAYPLRDASRAHADLEARATTGSLVLVVGVA